jgi:hypothetical protein
MHGCIHQMGVSNCYLLVMDWEMDWEEEDYPTTEDILREKCPYYLEHVIARPENM